MNEIFARWFVTLVVLFAVSGCSQATPAAPVEPDGLQPGPESIVTAPADALQPSVPITDDGGSGVADAEIEEPTADTVVAEAPLPTAIPDPITAITETRAYIDPDAGFAFDFPVTWSSVEYPGTMATITSFAPDEPGRGGMGRSDTKIDFTVNLAETESDLTAMAAQIRSGDQRARRAGVDTCRGDSSTPDEASRPRRRRDGAAPCRHQRPRLTRARLRRTCIVRPDRADAAGGAVGLRPATEPFGRRT